MQSHLNAYEHVYDELQRPIEESHTVAFPEACPLCDAASVGGGDGRFVGPTYECGGRYESKPQGQNHTAYWWGSCPSVRASMA